jgi:hypothetical protein
LSNVKMKLAILIGSVTSHSIDDCHHTLALPLHRLQIQWIP